MKKGTEITEPDDEQVEDKDRLKNLGLGALATKIGAQLQTKVADEVRKYDKPVKLKVLTGKEIKKMKS